MQCCVTNVARKSLHMMSDIMLKTSVKSNLALGGIAVLLLLMAMNSFVCHVRWEAHWLCIGRLQWAGRCLPSIVSLHVGDLDPRGSLDPQQSFPKRHLNQFNCCFSMCQTCRPCDMTSCSSSPHLMHCMQVTWFKS